jgi:hypothetical protein
MREMRANQHDDYVSRCDRFGNLRPPVCSRVDPRVHQTRTSPGAGEVGGSPPAIVGRYGCRSHISPSSSRSWLSLELPCCGAREEPNVALTARGRRAEA